MEVACGVSEANVGVRPLIFMHDVLGLQSLRISFSFFPFFFHRACVRLL